MQQIQHGAHAVADDCAGGHLRQEPAIDRITREPVAQRALQTSPFTCHRVVRHLPYRSVLFSSADVRQEEEEEEEDRKDGSERPPACKTSEVTLCVIASKYSPTYVEDRLHALEKRPYPSSRVRTLRR